MPMHIRPLGYLPHPEEESLGALPEDFALEQYVLPNTLGQREAEDILARYIIACQFAEGWFAIDGSLFIRAITEEARAIKATMIEADMARANNIKVRENFTRDTEGYEEGLLRWNDDRRNGRPYYDKPIAPTLPGLEPVIEPFLPDSMFLGQNRLVSWVTGIKYLLDNGYMGFDGIDGSEFIWVNQKALDAIESEHRVHRLVG